MHYRICIYFRYPREFDYEKEKGFKLLHKEALNKADHHPLKGIVVKETTAVRVISSVAPSSNHK